PDAARTLQWGRCANAAESFLTAAPLLIVDMCFNGAAARTQRRAVYLAPNTRIAAGFNGAAARTQRRGLEKVATDRTGLRLQWGRCANAAESTLVGRFAM